MSVAEKIRHYRLKENLMQKELAEKLDVSTACISSWEVGRTEPSLELLKRIRDFFAVTYDDLLNERSES